MTENRLNFYGRRKGRPLRKAMAELLETDLPRETPNKVEE